MSDTNYQKLSVFLNSIIIFKKKPSLLTKHLMNMKTALNINLKKEILARRVNTNMYNLKYLPCFLSGSYTSL